MAGHADLGEMTRMWAVERYIGHWDSYSGRPQPNNYYLYSDPLGVFQMLPWGTDQAWSQPHHGFAPHGDPACAELYRAALREVETVVSGLDPITQADRLAALLAPWQELEVAPRKPFGAALPAVQPALSPRLPVNRANLGRGLLLASFHAPGAGTVRLVAEIATARGAVTACAVSQDAAGAGPVGLACRLSPAVRRHLAARWLRLRVRVEVEVRGQDPVALDRTIRLPRTAV